ncbi:MAG: hydrogenase expression/formation C-terminal domain-containing protein [Chromatiaceae bacterium]
MPGLGSTTLAVEVSHVAQEWGNALPILHEVRHALERLATTGLPGIIDLRAIPFGPGDEARLLARLGRGEVEAVINALGETRIWESAIPAVWLIDHYNAEGERIALHIEIDRIPSLLPTQPEDLAEATARLDRILGGEGSVGALA